MTIELEIHLCKVVKLDLSDYGHEDSVTWDDLSDADKAEIKEDLVDELYNHITISAD